MYRRLVGSEPPLSLTLRYHRQAAAELNAEVVWYEHRLNGLGLRFKANVDAALDDLLVWLDSGAIWPGIHPAATVRSYGVHRFPYRVVYMVCGSELIVIAIAADKRKPDYWRDRLDGT